MSSELCTYCYEKPQSVDEKGKAYPCCKCGLNYDQALEASEFCAQVCLPLPKPVVAGWLRKVYDRCGRAFASVVQGAKPNKTPMAIGNFKGHCAYNGCTLPCYVNASGVPSLYCSPAHQELAQAPVSPNSCVQCRVKDRQPPSIFCSPACTTAVAKSTGTSVLIQLQAGHSVYSNVVNQFCKTWSNNSAQPTIYQVYKIIYNPKSYSKYLEYRKKVDAKGQHNGRNKGNETRRFYGTRRECTLGDTPGNLNPCRSDTCSLCSVIRDSFDMKKSKSGYGISTSSTSFKSDADSINPNSEFKAMILARMVLGKERVTDGGEGLESPPAGFDSVVQVTTNGSQTNKEATVYNNDAIRPSYLVVYKC